MNCKFEGFKMSPVWVYVFSIIFSMAFVVGTIIFKEREFLLNLSSIGVVGSIFTFLYQMFSDVRAREHQQKLQDERNAFEMGAVSHMAEKAFDMHIEFCEEYIKEVDAGLEILFRKGPHISAGDTVSRLVGIRLKYSLWITKEISSGLQPFETALWSIFRGEQKLKHLPVGNERTKVVDLVHEIFAKIMEIQKESSSDLNFKNDEVTRGYIHAYLQDILGVSELLKLRKALLLKANDSLVELPS